MALTLEELAVNFTVNGENNVIQAFINIENASNQARTALAQNMEGMGGAFGGLQSRMNSLAVSGAFAMESLAEGGERGLLRFARAIGMLGLSIDPMIGAVILLGAVVGEQLVEKFQKGQKAAEDAAKAFVKAIGDMANVGNVVGLQQKMIDLMKGTPVGEDGVRAARINSGAWAGYWTNGYAYVSAHVGELAKQMGEFTAKQQEVPQALRDEFNKFNDLEISLRHNIEQTRREMTSAGVEAGNRIEIVAEETRKREEAARKAAELAEQQRRHEEEVERARYEYKMELAKGDYDEQLRLTDARLAHLKAAGEKELVAYTELLKRRAAIELEYDAKGKALKTALQEALAKEAETTLKQQLVDAGSNLALQEAAYAAYAQAIGNIFGQMSVKYAEAMLERLRIHNEELKQEEAAERDHQKLMDEFAKDQARQKKEYEQKNRQAARETADMIEQIYTEAFGSGGGIGKAAKQLGATLLKHMGEVFMAQGDIYGVYGAIMQSLSAFLPNPFTAGPAAIAIGLALTALGTALGASASAPGGAGGYGGGGYGSVGGGNYVYGATSTTGTVVVNPVSTGMTSTSGVTPARPVTNNITVIGKDDPQAQRQILQLIQKAQTRGASTAGHGAL